MKNLITVFILISIICTINKSSQLWADANKPTIEVDAEFYTSLLINKDKSDSIKLELERYQRLSSALGNMLRDYYHNSENGNDFFDDVIAETDEYYVADSLLRGGFDKLLIHGNSWEEGLIYTDKK